VTFYNEMNHLAYNCN